MRNLHKILVFILIISISFSFMIWPSADDTVSSVVFKASEPDADGNFTLDMTIYNAKFNVFQFILRYDPATVVPTDANGKATDKFSEFKETNLSGWLLGVGEKIDKEKGLISFTSYVSPGTSYSTDNSEISGVACVGNEGLKVCTFHFKKVSDKDVDLELATISESKPYQKKFPEGGALIYSGYAISSKFTMDLSGTSGSKEEVSMTGISQDSISADGKVDEAAVEQYKSTQKTEAAVSESKTETSGADDNSSTEVTAEQSSMDKSTRAKGTVILQIGNYAAAVEGYLVHIYPGEKEVVPYIDDNSRTMVPVRFIAERLGATVDWDNAARVVTITSGDTVIKLPIDSKTYTVNGVTKQMDTAAIINHSRTMVPIRFVAEALGKAVEWDAANRLVIITPGDEPWDLNGEAEKELTSDVLFITSALLRDMIA